MRRASQLANNAASNAAAVEPTTPPHDKAKSRRMPATKSNATNAAIEIPTRSASLRGSIASGTRPHLHAARGYLHRQNLPAFAPDDFGNAIPRAALHQKKDAAAAARAAYLGALRPRLAAGLEQPVDQRRRSEEHTSELQSRGHLV